MTKESGGFVKAKAKGAVNFPPFENLGEASLREIKRYQIYPFGRIQDYCRHIPYNSGKKDFYEKTGRESFEVFQYIFKCPGDDTEYTVMWDYNVGLVRMTPFFKCCKYSKTMPAKMLNMNPGLRDITHSITGGSIMAQGYWMPFACAKAVCATFCGAIAGALIPIFGPDFPSQCVSPGSPEHGRMAIDPAVVAESAREAEMFRRMYVNSNAVASNSHLPLHPHQQILHHYSHGPALPSPTSIPSPRLARRGLHRPESPYDYDRERVDFGGRMRFKSGLDGPYGVDSDPEMHTGPDTPSLHQAMHRSMPYSPMSPPRSSGWTVANNVPRPHSSSTPSSNYQHGFREGFPYSGGPNPLLSAIPRFGHQARLDQYQTSHRLPPISQTSAAWNAAKRPAPEVDGDCEYDGQSESSPTTTITTMTTTSRASAGRNQEDEGNTSLASSTVATAGAEKNAALLLMNLSVRDIREVWGQENKREEEHGGRHPRGCGPESMSMSPVSAMAEGHRSKRRRATSM
ncbi:Transcriptional repressor XBP1 [Cytospora mali]|uniref:Transcriptional repressor XBP1 n=1 Tax=Cytospora mali TaxID=578113 RepID=A0A194V0J0_CYTMA|nr:Transcriptional repressor XBP1 [Valsa mali var. pyri (nom. inval.)]